jgi:hypothetical protein
MDEPVSNYRHEFLRSKHHVWLGLVTLGLGFLLGADKPLYLLLGAAAYVLGWIYMPDMPFFRRVVDSKHDAVKQGEDARQLAEFQQKRTNLLASLAPSLRTRYHELAEVCNQIEKGTADGPLTAAGSPDPRLLKLDELMWTFLRLLHLEDILERFLETERREDLPGRVRDAEAEIGAVGRELETMKKQIAGAANQDAKERLLQSRLEALEVLRKRQARVEQAQANLALVRSEQERLDFQIKLIRADAMAANSTSSISARIDATVEQLDQTNKWLAEINDFKDVVGDFPSTDTRVGYRAQPALPPLVNARPASTKSKLKEQK